MTTILTAVRKPALAAAAAVSAMPAMAETALYTSGDYYNAATPFVNGLCSPCSNSQFTQTIGDRFTLLSAATVTSTDFAIQANYGSNWNISVTIYDAGMSVLASSTHAPGSYGLDHLANSNVTMVHADLPSLSLNSGTYYVTWSDDTDMAIPGYTASGAKTMFVLGYSTIGVGGAFRIGGIPGAVPEAPGYAMLLAGLGLLGYAARRRAG